MPTLAPEGAEGAFVGFHRWMEEGTAVVYRIEYGEFYDRALASYKLSGNSQYYRIVDSLPPLELDLWHAADQLRQRGVPGTAVKAAKIGLQWLQSEGLSPRKIVPSVEDGVALFLREGDRRAEVEYLNDETVTVVMYRSQGPINVIEVENASQFGEAALPAIVAFLGSTTR